MTDGPGANAAAGGRSNTTARLALLLFILAAAWLLWSGLYKPLLLGLGAFSCVLTCYVVRRMGYFDGDFFMLRFSGRFFGYLLWLTQEVVRSSIEVARVVLTPSLPISPQVIEIEAGGLNPVDQAILGNSITLTPGTLTLDLHDDRITVHTLTKAGARALVASRMDQRVADLHDD